MNKKLFSILLPVSMAGVLLLSGCAGTVPKADFTKGMKLTSRITSDDDIRAQVEADKGVSILDMEKARLAQRIEQRVASKKILNASSKDKNDYEIQVTLTKYEKGNAFARAMLAGLGQIHIEGIVRLYEGHDRKKVSEFNVAKTFAWGGIYGGVTSMEDIENTFADGIAATVTGQEEDN